MSMSPSALSAESIPNAYHNAAFLDNDEEVGEAFSLVFLLQYSFKDIFKSSYNFSQQTILTMILPGLVMALTFTCMTVNYIDRYSCFNNHESAKKDSTYTTTTNRDNGSISCSPLPLTNDEVKSHALHIYHCFPGRA